MKKRSLLTVAALTLVSVFGLTGCGKNELVGEWKGTWNCEKYMLEAIAEEDEELAEQLDFSGLKIGFNFEFEEETLSMSVDEDVLDEFVEKMESEMIAYAEAMLEEAAAESDMSADQMLSLIGYTHDQYIDEVVESMDLESMADELVTDLEENDAEYEVDEDVIKVTYDDGSEKWKFELEGDEMTIKVSDEEIGEIKIDCERQ